MAGYLLLESGSKVLLESGSALVLENFTSASAVTGTVNVAVRGLTGRYKVRGLTT